MGDTKPKILWHADDKGKCHLACEQAFQNDHDFNTAEVWCQLMAKVVPTNARMHTNGDPCPFALLADVLCAVKPHGDPVEKFTSQDITSLMDASWRCGCSFGRDVGGGNTDGEPEARDADVKRLLATVVWCHDTETMPEEDRRCGTCLNRDDQHCPFLAEARRSAVRGDSIVYDDGPPWPNCRFWRAR